MIKKMNSWGKETKDVTDKIPPKKWHKYYKALLNSNDPRCSEVDPVDYPPTYLPLLDGIISKMELKTALSDLKRNKIGPDGVLSDYLKVFGDMYENLLLNIMNGLFSNTLYPKEWDINFLKPIHKKGDVLDV